MKGYVLAIFFVAALSSATCSRHGDELMTRLKLKYVESYLQERQAIDDLSSRMEQVCPGSKTKFEDSIDELKACADKIDETAETSCSIVKNRMPKCIEPVMKVLKDCMPARSKGIPDFALKSILKGVDYICKSDGEHIFELGNTCLYKQNPMSLSCSRKLKMRAHTFQRNGFAVEDLCSMMNYMRPCLKSHLSLSCGSPVTQEAIVGLFDALLSNCQAVTTSSSSKEFNEVEDVQVNQLEDLLS